MLGDDELQRLEEACDMSLELNQSKHRIYEYVESKMSFIAPNLSIIVGASTAAKIMGENKTVELRIVSCPKITIVIYMLFQTHMTFFCGIIILFGVITYT